jgi:aryl-alcohol dehydrogenase-like predicted oxidoreductase
MPDNTNALGGTIDVGDRTVHRLGYGAMRITGPGIWRWPKDRDNARAVLRRVVELGIDFIDTADSYGPDVSETLIGEALFPYPDDLVIATKAGLTRSGPNRWHPDGRPQHIRAACEGSLTRLKLDALHVYQLHRPDPKVPLADSLGTMVELQHEGKVRLIGLCNVNEKQLAEAQTITPIVSVQNRYNATDRESEAVLQRCEQQAIAFLPWRPVGGGQLDAAGKGLAEVATRRQATEAQVALAWLLAHSPVMLPIPGTGSLSHLEENTAAARLQLSADDLAELG